MNIDCQTYAAWIEKNIREAMLESIKAETKNPDSDQTPKDG
jgi:hypothetical protein